MKEISTIQQAEEYIYTYDFFSNLNENKDALYPILKSCEQLAVQHQRDNLLCRTRTYLLYLYIEENKLDMASGLAALNLQYANSHLLEDELLYMIAIIAHLYQLTGDYSSSEELIQIALDKIPVIQDDLKRCKIYLMIAEQYYFTNDKNRCLEAFNKCIQYALKTNDAALIAICYNNYADKLINYQLLSDINGVIETGYRYALLSKNKSIIQQLNDKYGAYYSLQKDYKKANRYLSKSIDYYMTHQNINKANEVKLDLIQLCVQNRKFKKAYSLLQELEQTALASNANKLVLQVYRQYTAYFESKKKYEEAFLYLKKYNQAYTLVHNEESDEKIKNLQIQYEVKTIQSERDNANKLARIKHDFLSNMSHEIRTPINNILGICYLMQQDQLSKKQQDYMMRLNRSGEQLLGIINDILDISKIEAGKFHLVLNAFSPEDFLQNIHRQFAHKAADKNIGLTLSIEKNIPGYCMGDTTRLGQVLGNLLSNAIKFTPNGSVELRLELDAISEHTAHLKFMVKDSGIGMNEEQLKKIFNEYEQAENTTQLKFGGTGLGLSISKKLVELMNGKIAVSSQLHTGTTFTVHIPLALSNEKIIHTVDEKINCEELDGKLIYIADDIEENRKVMSELLASLNPGIQIGLAENGKQLLELTDKQMPDIIFMDLDMPEKNGFETTSELRKAGQHDNVRIIACTASLLTMTKDELLSMGFNNLLQKPYTIQQLSMVLV